MSRRGWSLQLYGSGLARRGARRVGHPARLVGRPAAVVAAIIGLWGVTTVGPTAAAVAVSPYTITVAQTSGLTDGTPVPVTVASSDPVGNPVGWVDLRICRPGVAYTSYAVVETRGNCGFSPGSSAYTSPTGSATQDFPGVPSGATSFPDTFVAGVGSARYAGFSLTCDATHPCDLVVSVFTSQTQAEGTTAQDVQSFPLTFLPFGAVDGCRGTAAGAIQSVSSDRLVEAFADWSKAACSGAGPGDGEAATINTFLNEGGPFGAVDSFANGSADMAYAAGGYDLPGFSEPTGRPYVAVPVAINAVVLAASGGQQVAAYTPKGGSPVTASTPYSHIRLTAAQAASLFGGGYVSAAQIQGIDAENPQLAAGAQVVPYTPPGGSSFIYPQAVAGVSATTVFASGYFTTMAGPAWNSGPYAPSGQPTHVRRGVISSFAQPGAGEPAFTSLGLYSHRTDLERAALPYVGLGPLPLWVLTDRATATELGFTVGSLGAGAAATPTTATVDAAVVGLRPEPDGTLRPGRIRTGAGRTAAYPLTFVEYALVPTEPLVDASCHPRTRSERLMIQWLHFVTGPGQRQLAAGLVPLTPTLDRQAAAAIAKVGRAAATGACGPHVKAPVVPVPTSPTTAAPAPPVTAGTASPPPTTTPVRRRAPAPPPVAPQASSSTTPASSVATPGLAAVQIPRLATRRQAGGALPSVGLVLLGALSGGMALRTSGRARRARLGAHPPEPRRGRAGEGGDRP